MTAPCRLCGATGKRHAGRGLCGADYELLRRRGLLDSFRPHKRPSEMVLDEYVFLREIGVSVQEIPARLEMSPAAFERAMHRARAGGDPRAASFAGMKVTA